MQKPLSAADGAYRRSPDDASHWAALGLSGTLGYAHSETSAVTTAWGVAWDETMIARDLLQNFYDANREDLDAVTVSANGTTVTIAAPAQVNLLRLFYLGSEKDDDDVGQYGEGFKAAALCLLRDFHVEPVVISGADVVCLRLAEEGVDGTSMVPMVYDYYQTTVPETGTRLVLPGCGRRLISELQTGLDHFLHPGNRRLGALLWQSGEFALYRSATPNGSIFYRNLLRAEIADLPLVLVIGKQYADIQKAVAQDRDRRAFGPELLGKFYRVFTRNGCRASTVAVRHILEAARPLWPRGHALLAELARTRPYGASLAKEVFGDGFYAITHSGDAAQQFAYGSIEAEWQRSGRQPLPAYFAAFGVTTASQVTAQREARAREESVRANRRLPTRAEQASIELLQLFLVDLAGDLCRFLQRRIRSHTVARTDTVLGELREGRSYRDSEVFLAESVFLDAFPAAVATYLHECAHLFGRDGSRGFSDALTELIECVIVGRAEVDAHEALWEQARRQVHEERSQPIGHENHCLQARLLRLSGDELREVLSRLAPATLRRLLEDT